MNERVDMSTPVRVLVVDDSALMRKVLRTMLTESGFEVETARNGIDALEQVRRNPPDVVTLDVNMPEMDGMSCLAQLMTENPLPVVMVSSLTEPDAPLTFEALELGAVDFVPKPGGTVSLDLAAVRQELVSKVRAASRAQVRRSGGLRERLRRHREQELLRVPDRRPSASAAGAAGAPPASRSRPPQPRRRLAGLWPELVLIGSSTGGPAALAEVLSGLPATFSAPIVIAQHIPASFTRHLAERMNEDCALEVREVAGVELLRPGTVYLGRGDADLLVGRRPGGLIARSVPPSADYRWHPSVDRMVDTALAACTDACRVIGVLLTGMGDDGAQQLTRLRRLGGRTIAESEETAVVHGMPGELVRLDGADVVLPVHEIGAQLAAWG